MIDVEIDRDLPQRVYSAWKPTTGPRPLRRALTVDERSRGERRIAELEIGLEGVCESQRRGVEDAMLAMFAGFRTMRHKGEAVDAIVAAALHATRGLPAWAIKEACQRIADGEAGLDPHWPPNDAEIRLVTTQIVQPFRERLGWARDLLAAPVETEEPRALPRRSDLPPPAPLPLSPRDRGHVQRALADIEARRSGIVRQLSADVDQPVAWEGA